MYGMSELQTQMYQMGLVQNFDYLCRLIIDNPDAARAIALNYINRLDTYNPVEDQVCSQRGRDSESLFWNSKSNLEMPADE